MRLNILKVFLTTLVVAALAQVSFRQRTTATFAGRDELRIRGQCAGRVQLKVGLGKEGQTPGGNGSHRFRRCPCRERGLTPCPEFHFQLHPCGS